MLIPLFVFMLEMDAGDSGAAVRRYVVSAMETYAPGAAAHETYVAGAAAQESYVAGVVAEEVV